MHPNPAFRQTATDDKLQFARRRGFGMLAVNGPDGPLMSHVPFLLSDDAASIDLHLVRSNPISRLTGPLPAVIAVTGPDGYVSPDWYGTPDQVPTWNYVAVHLRGNLSRLPDDALRDVLERQSAAYEARLHKRPWTIAKMTPAVLDRMMRQIVPFRIAVTDVQGTWKLNQNKPDAARLAAAEGLAADPFGSEVAALAKMMRETPDP